LVKLFLILVKLLLILVKLLLVFIFAPCIYSDENSFIVPMDALNNIKPQL
jgi:hypothetical protein